MRAKIAEETGSLELYTTSRARYSTGLKHEQKGDRTTVTRGLPGKGGVVLVWDFSWSSLNARAKCHANERGLEYLVGDI